MGMLIVAVLLLVGFCSWTEKQDNVVHNTISRKVQEDFYVSDHSTICNTDRFFTAVIGVHHACRKGGLRERLCHLPALLPNALLRHRQ